MSKNRELSLEPEQLSFGSAIELSLFGGGIASISLGDMARNSKGGENDSVRSRFRLATRAMSHDAEDFAAERDCLLPDLEIPEAPCHGAHNGGLW